MDFQDLLYTNQFTSEDVLTGAQIESAGRNYGQFQKYMARGPGSNATQRYLQNGTYQDDAINVQQTMNARWPTTTQNSEPLLSDFAKDIGKNRYRKTVITGISVSSRDRDISKYLYSNDFFIPFSKQFTNISQIVIKDILFPNTYPPVNPTNNIVAWQYATRNDLIAYNIDGSIVPQPKIANNIEIQDIFYSEISSQLIVNGKTYRIPSVSMETNSQYMVYQTNLPEGYYDTQTLTTAFEKTCNKIVHGATYLNLKELERTNITPLTQSNLSEVFIPTRSVPWKYVYEEPYQTSQLLVNSPNNMTMEINTTTHEVKVVNRMEKLEVASLQTFDALDEDYASTDIFYAYSLNPNKGTANYIDPNYVYLTVPQSKSSTAFYYNSTPGSTTFQNAFPLVITGLKDAIGNISADIFNFTTFFDLNIYTQNGYIETNLDSVCTYKIWDEIEVRTPTGTLVQKYVRFALKLSTGNLNGYDYDPFGYAIRPTASQTHIYSTTLANFLEKNDIYAFDRFADGVYVGRALLFRWIFDIDEDQYVDYEVEADYEKPRSLLKLLGWSVPNKTYNLHGISNQPIYKFVHSNVQNKVYQEAISQSITNKIFQKASPQRKMNLQLYEDKYYMKSYDYIFMKISPDNTKNGIENALIQAIDNTHLNLNAIYIDPSEIAVGIGENETNSTNPIFDQADIYTKQRTQLFSKVLISSIPNQLQTAQTMAEERVLFYEKPLENLAGIYVEILSEDLKKIKLGSEYSFTLDIYETVDVLKETNIDSRRDEIHTTGIQK